MLGLFEDPFRRIDEKREKCAFDASEATVRSRAKSGRKSIVLLKNDGDLLPLPALGQEDRADRSVRERPARPRRTVGGLWRRRRRRSISPPAFARGSPTRTALIIAEGSGVEEPLAGGIEQAVAAARQADIVVLAIGEAQGMSGEAQSRTEIVVPEAAAGAGRSRRRGRQAGRRRPQARPRARARRRGRERAGDPCDLVPRHRDRQCDRRRAVRRLQPVRTSAGELPAPCRARSPIITRTSRPGAQSRIRSSSQYKAHFRGIPNTRALSVRARPDLREDRLQRLRAQRAGAADERRDRGQRRGHQPRYARRRRSRSALHARSRRRASRVRSAS